MSAPQNLQNVPNDVAPLESNGLFGRTWYLFFQSVIKVGNYCLTSVADLFNRVIVLESAKTSGRSAQADLATLAGTLNATNAGFLVEVTDYRHVLRWTGSAWSWGPGEDGRHDVVGLPVDPDDTTGWQLCDGTTVAYLKGDGTTANFATPDLTSAANKAAYLKLGTPVAGPTAATAPTFTGNAIGFTTSQAVIAVGGTFLTGPSTQPITGSVSATGEPRNYELRPWFRR